MAQLEEKTEVSVLEQEIRTLKIELYGKGSQDASFFFQKIFQQQSLQEKLENIQAKLEEDCEQFEDIIKLEQEQERILNAMRTKEAILVRKEGLLQHKKLHLAQEQAFKQEQALKQEQPAVSSSDGPSTDKVNRKNALEIYLNKEFPCCGWLLYKATEGMIDNPKAFLADHKGGKVTVTEYVKLAFVALCSQIIVAMNNWKNTFTANSADKHTVEPDQTQQTTTPQIKV